MVSSIENRGSSLALFLLPFMRSSYCSLWCFSGGSQTQVSCTLCISFTLSWKFKYFLKTHADKGTTFNSLVFTATFSRVCHRLLLQGAHVADSSLKLEADSLGSAWFNMQRCFSQAEHAFKMPIKDDHVQSTVRDQSHDQLCSPICTYLTLSYFYHNFLSFYICVSLFL